MRTSRIDSLFVKLPATEPNSAWDVLNIPYLPMLPSDRILANLRHVIDGLSCLPDHLVIDDGAFQPPYKNAAFRAEAAWHRDALHDITERLSAAI